MQDSLNVFFRFVLYVDLTLLAGLPLICVLGFRENAHQVATAIGLRWVLVVLASLGVVLSGCHMVMLAMSMIGVSEVGELGLHVFTMMITGTDAGVAWAVRVVALTFVALVALSGRLQNALSLKLAAALGLVSLATIAWSGHGAMGEDALRYFHFATDIIHLTAAAAWIGALVTFVLLIRPSRLASNAQLRLLHQGLSGFAWIGTSIVLALVATGVGSYCLIAGAQLSTLVSSRYGLLLLAKLSLFAVMLALAVANRYYLTPMLGRKVGMGQPAGTLSRLRRSLVMETGAAILILVAVAWLGTLDPAQ